MERKRRMGGRRWCAAAADSSPTGLWRMGAERSSCRPAGMALSSIVSSAMASMKPSESERCSRAGLLPDEPDDADERTRRGGGAVGAANLKSSLSEAS